jgi:glutamate/aspartate transport system substrate-binding protein
MEMGKDSHLIKTGKSPQSLHLHHTTRKSMMTMTFTTRTGVKPLAAATLAVLALGLTACNKTPDNNAAGNASQPAATTSEATLDKIKKSGEIVLAYRDSSIPFSYIANTPNQPVGYAHDLQLKVVDAVKKELNMPNLKVRYNLVTSQTRIPLVQNGTVDLECGSTTNNEERQKQVDFSVGFFEIGTRLLTAKDSGIKDFADLKGKTLVTTAGTTSERFIKKLNEDKKLGINIVSAKDHGESFLMLESGRAAAFMMDDVLLAGEKAKAKDPSKWEIVGTPQSFEIYGCMVRKGDTAFKKLVDDTLKATYASGEINQIYNKWFMSPIPPKNINMNFTMSDNLKNLLANPHDGAQPHAVTAVASNVSKAIASGVAAASVTK